MAGYIETEPDVDGAAGVVDADPDQAGRREVLPYGGADGVGDGNGSDPVGERRRVCPNAGDAASEIETCAPVLPAHVEVQTEGHPYHGHTFEWDQRRGCYVSEDGLIKLLPILVRRQWGTVFTQVGAQQMEMAL